MNKKHELKILMEYLERNGAKLQLKELGEFQEWLKKTLKIKSPSRVFKGE